MTNNKSVFRYKIIDNHESPKEIIEKVSEELNRGLTFIVSQTDEKVVTIAGEWKGWVTTAIRGNNVYIYVDDGFFSSCVLEQILTSLWANLLDFGEIRLEEFQLSDNLHAFLSSGNLNKQSIQKLVRINGPYFGTVFKPSFDLSFTEKLNIAEKFANIGGVFIKEDETYLIEKSRLLKESKFIQRAMNAVSNHCFYVPNVTPYLLDDNLFQELYEIGIRVVMVNYLIIGLPIVHKILKRNKKLLFWGHRVGYKSLQRYISMKVVALLATYSGMNIIHIGTPFFSENNSVKECVTVLKSINKVNTGVIPVFTKASFHIISDLIKSFGKKIIIMAGGPVRTKGHLDWKKMKRLIETIQNNRSQRFLIERGSKI